jgi:hypothetical protein
MNLVKVGFTERPTMLQQTMEVLRRVARHTEPVSMRQTVYDHLAQIIPLQKEITDHK